MTRVLHLLKADSSSAALPVIERQSRESGARITVVLLHGALFPALPPGVTVHRLAENGSEGALTHSQLLDLIFQSDSVISW